jgi:glycosyltransferase involved in cell wall biosynthesis
VPKISEGSMFVKRMLRKLKSLTRGFVRVSERFGVLSPFVIPGRLGMNASRGVLRPQVARAARRMGITRPLAWVECPSAAEILERLAPQAVVYQRTDRIEAFPDGEPSLLGKYDVYLKQKADVTLYCSTLLFREERERCRHAAFVDHGVDFEQFATAGDDGGGAPADLSSLPRPRIGFIGAIDSHTFDPELFLGVARRLPECHFVLVGACTLPIDWCGLQNVSVLGQRPYGDIARYMAACDVLIMPWNQSEWIKACNPVKLKEYLAVGRPVVSTDFVELERYEGLVQKAHGPDEFAARIRAALREGCDRHRLRERVRRETWAAKSEAVLQDLASQGIVFGK